jgi:hypothetical protein
MADRPIERICRDAGAPQLVETLAALPPTDLQTLMLEVYARQALQTSPARVLAQHRENRFVRPAEASPRRLLELDQRAWQHLPPGYEPLELSPLAPLGASSALATVSQNKVVATARNTEVLSDATNVLALEAAVRRRAGEEVVTLAASHRLVRAQALSSPHHRAHFRLLHLCAAGRGRDFELFQLQAQLAFFHRFLAPFGALRVALTPLDASGEKLAGELEDVMLDPDRKSGRGYYRRLCFKLFLDDAEVGDGGFTDWTQKLLSDAKERLLVSAVATERLAKRP